MKNVKKIVKSFLLILSLSLFSAIGSQALACIDFGGGGGGGEACPVVLK